MLCAGEVDGDSASSAEVYAILSSLANVPIKQSLAVTGSVSQHGEIQPIGTINEKNEGGPRLVAWQRCWAVGFYDVGCHSGGGLTGEQGVIVPHLNRHNLMLRPVREHCPP